MEKNYAAIVKERFNLEPGDEKYYDTLMAVSKDTNYGLTKPKTKETKQASTKKKSGLGGSNLNDMLTTYQNQKKTLKGGPASWFSAL